MGSIKYDVANFAQAIAYANQMNSEMESAKSECLGILSGVNPPADLDISGEIGNVKGIIESMSTRVAEVRSTIESLRSQIESTDASIASQIAYYIGNETAYIRNTGEKIGVEQVVGNKPNPKDYADGENDEAYIKDLEKYNLKLAAYEAFSEGKIDYNYLKSTYGEEIATEIQKAYGKQYSGWQEGEGKSIVEGVSDIATGVKDAAVLFATDPTEFYVRTKATIANTGAAVIKGGLDIVEGAVDLGTAIGGAVGAGVAKWTGHEETSKKISEKTSSFISTDWVDKGYEYVYNTAGGQWLDSKSLLKHDSQAFDTIAGFGKMAGLIAISAVASPAVGAIVAGTSAGGETIEKDFQNLGGSTSDLGEYGKTLLHGTLAGALEGAMWYGGSKVALGGDLALSVVDPVARTGVQMISPTENRNFKEIFNEDYGGAKGILTNMAFSILGNKLFDRFSNKENIDIESKLGTKQNVVEDMYEYERKLRDVVFKFSDENGLTLNMEQKSELIKYLKDNNMDDVALQKIYDDEKFESIPLLAILKQKKVENIIGDFTRKNKIWLKEEEKNELIKYLKNNNVDGSSLQKLYDSGNFDDLPLLAKKKVESMIENFADENDLLLFEEEKEELIKYLNDNNIDFETFQKLSDAEKFESIPLLGKKKQERIELIKQLEKENYDRLNETIIDLRKKTRVLSDQELKDIMRDIELIEKEKYNIIRTYLEKNLGIDLEHIPAEVLTREVKGSRTMYAEKKYKYVKEVDIEDIVGSVARPGDTLITHMLEDSRYETNALKHMNDDVLETYKQANSHIELGLTDVPGLTMIDLLEYNPGEYYIDDDGNHRVTCILLKYLNELSKCKTAEEIKNLKKMYKIKAFVRTDEPF